MRKVSVLSMLVVLLAAFLCTSQAAAQTTISLKDAKAMVREQGRDLKLLDLSKSQAELGLAMAKGKAGIGSRYDSKAMKKDMDNLESYIDERVQAITLLEKNIEQWKENKEDPEADTGELERLIDQACRDKSQYQMELDDIRPAYASLVLRYHPTKAQEDMLKSQFKPYEDALDQLSDAQILQPKLMDYRVEQLYYSLLAFAQQEQLMSKALQLAQRALEIEELKHILGLSTPLQVQAAEAELLQSEEALQNLKADWKDYSSNLLYLLGLPLDFKFKLVPVNLEKEYPDVGEDKMPDFTQSVAFLRVYRNLEDAQEELDDTSKFDNKEYRLAEIKVEEAELQLQKTLEELEKNYFSKKESYQVAGGGVAKAALSLQQAQATQAAAELQHKLGMLAPLELEGVKLACLQADLAYYSALVQRQLACQAYLLACDGITF